MTENTVVPVFEARNISKSFDKRQVLNIDHIVFEKGKIYCLYGSNGSGKTTLFETLMNIQKERTMVPRVNIIADICP
jgi:ABC-type multidrug transport system ATPase subunit